MEAALEPARLSGGPRPWALYDTAASGDGVQLGLEWLVDAVRRAGGAGGA